MFKWIKNVFGIGEVEKAVEAIQPEAVKDAPSQKLSETVAVQAKNEKKVVKKATKKTKVDLGSMSKNDLLAHAKKNGIKANASMKKADILAAINKG